MSAVAPAPLRGVLLDLDDTLVPWQTPLHWQWAWRPRGPLLPERHLRAAIRRQLHLWDRERWLGLVGRGPVPDVESYRRFLSETLGAIAGYALPDEEAHAVVERFLRPAHEPESYLDAAPAVRGLEAAGLRVGVLSDLPRETARLALRRGGLSDALLLLAGDDTGPRPPAAQGFRAAAAKIELRPSELLYAGDLFWSDVRAAGRADLHAVLVDRGIVGARLQGPRVTTLAMLRELAARPPEPVAAQAPGEPDGPEP